MLLVRRFEEKCAEVYQQQKIRGFLHLQVGEEAVVVGAMGALEDSDSVVAPYREHGHALMRGISPAAVMAEMFGKATGCARGRGGSMHLFDAGRRFWGGYAIVGGGLPVAVGLALAERKKGTDRVVACFFGDGATAEGAYHESLNLAALWKLPVLFLCENNLYAMGTSIERFAAETNLRREPDAHKEPAETVDGMDVLAVRETVRHAAAAIRRGEGPRFVEMRTYRFRAHSMYDAEKYRTKEEVAEQKKRDPIALWVATLTGAGLCDERTRARLEEEAAKMVEDAVREADAAPLEPVAELERFVVGEAIDPSAASGGTR
ncbi:MAG: pyruvate dehydrogenase (acetyl-transferring) E1 component subunit alpha [Deltaproteobacteria bacterium]